MMYFAKVLNNWKESLQLFKPENFKLFLLVSLKTTLSSLQIFSKYFFWLAIINFLTVVSIFGFGAAERSILILNAISILLILPIIICTTRPSLELKNLEYFSHYLSKCFVILAFLLLEFVILICLFDIILFLVFLGKDIYIIHNAISWIFYFFKIFLMFFDFAFSLFAFPYIYFALDSKLDIKNLLASQKRAALFIFWYLPSYLILAVSCYLLSKLVIASSFYFYNLNLGVLGVIFVIFIYLIVWLFQFFFLAAFATLYTKIKHSNFSLFFS